MIKDYFFRVRLELDESDPDERVSLAFDFPEGETAVRFAELAYRACDIINADIKIIHNEIDTTESPMWRMSDPKMMLNSKYGLVYKDTDSVKEAKEHDKSNRT